MSEYVPTTEEIAGWWAHKGDSPASPYYASKLTKRAKEFDRWLATHDAEKRAEWEAEAERHNVQLLREAVKREALAEQGETEWEYGLMADGDDEPWSDYSADLDWLISEAGSSISSTDRAVRRRKAGPWEPVPDTTNNESENE